MTTERHKKLQSNTRQPHNNHDNYTDSNRDEMHNDSKERPQNSNKLQTTNK